mmetsp:Transcript_9604/g.35601  ORF Transcript_9604/g.35601 Transcript_9604/m.35601 type:complete len:200 (-) Transcript_9604:899-1498(-)
MVASAERVCLCERGRQHSACHNEIMFIQKPIIMRAPFVRKTHSTIPLTHHNSRTQQSHSSSSPLAHFVHIAASKETTLCHHHIILPFNSNSSEFIQSHLLWKTGTFYCYFSQFIGVAVERHKQQYLANIFFSTHHNDGSWRPITTLSESNHCSHPRHLSHSPIHSPICQCNHASSSFFSTLISLNGILKHGEDKAEEES